MVEGRPPNTDINSIEKLPQLAERDPPKFKNEKLWSKQMIDFLAHCLIKDVEKRPSAIDLLGTVRLIPLLIHSLIHHPPRLPIANPSLSPSP